MAATDIYFLPSNMEEFGVVLLEAQATGLPVVATRVGGVPEAAPEGRSAILIPKGDVGAAVEALQSLLDHPDRWAVMGSEGRRHVEEHHDMDPLNARLEFILRG
jgi:colanic acid/amylovoran biosynthesis glycosyltransferase